jgi:hypothetical protein
VIFQNLEENLGSTELTTFLLLLLLYYS